MEIVVAVEVAVVVTLVLSSVSVPSLLSKVVVVAVAVVG